MSGKFVDINPEVSLRSCHIDGVYSMRGTLYIEAFGRSFAVVPQSGETIEDARQRLIQAIGDDSDLQPLVEVADGVWVAPSGVAKVLLDRERGGAVLVMRNDLNPVWLSHIGSVEELRDVTTKINAARQR